MKRIRILLFFSILLFTTGCSNLGEMVPLDVDRTIGQQYATQLEAMSGQGEILDSTKYPEVYAYLDTIKNRILASGKVKHKDDFPWRLKIIHNDTILNAFCVAGGYIYVYTGLIKFLDNEAELAGVLGHEIAHADHRHTTMRIMSEYGISAVIALVTGGDASVFVNIGRKLLGLSFSRSDEKEADESAVLYLYHTTYDGRGVGGFFKKMIEEKKDVNIPVFLSTHPASENRVEDINAYWKELGAKEGKFYKEKYAEIKKLLPS